MREVGTEAAAVEELCLKAWFLAHAQPGFYTTQEYLLGVVLTIGTYQAGYKPSGPPTSISNQGNAA